MPIIIIAIILFFIVVCGVSYRLETTTYTFNDSRINNDITITVIADLHGSLYGPHNQELLKVIDNTKPDIVLLPGDIYDDRYNIGASDDLIKGLKCKNKYMVLGNHELGNNDLTSEIKTITSSGVKLLRNQNETITINNTKLTVIGCDDIKTDKQGWPKQLNKSFEGVVGDNYKILLCHRPHFIEDFKNTNADLIVSGHAHGGQWCIPFTKKGVLAPQQGFFPKYTSGTHELEDKTMVVSRGLSKHPLFVPRLFNRPEIVVIKLQKKTS